jgi:hypothetical protein
MTESLRIESITLQIDNSKGRVVIVLNAPLPHEGQHRMGIDYRTRNAESHQASMLKRDGVVDAGCFVAHGGRLDQVTESYDVNGSLVVLWIGGILTSADFVDVQITGFLDLDGTRVQSDVPVMVEST